MKDGPHHRFGDKTREGLNAPRQVHKTDLKLRDLRFSLRALRLNKETIFTPFFCLQKSSKIFVCGLETSQDSNDSTHKEPFDLALKHSWMMLMQC